MLSENERRQEHQNQRRPQPFCSHAQTWGIWKESFHWQNTAKRSKFPCACAMLRFHKAYCKAKASTR